MKHTCSVICLATVYLGSLTLSLAQSPASPPLEELPSPPAPATPPDFVSPSVTNQLYPNSAGERYLPASEVHSLREQLSFAEQRLAAAEARAQNAESNYPLFILLLFFAFPVAFLGGVLFARYKNYQRLNETVRGLMERNIAIPPELLSPTEVSKPKLSDFRRGLLLLWSGIGIMFLFGIILHGSRAWGLGLIPVFTGLAYLALWRLDRRKEMV